jgi:hypothetical protein
MRRAPEWLAGAAAGFATLPPESQRAALECFVEELRTRGVRQREGIRSEDHQVFDAALAGLILRASSCRDMCVSGAAPLAGEAFESLAMDNRGIGLLEGLVLVSARLAARSVGIDVSDH